MNETATHTGGCLCGGVRYEVDGPLRDVVACHCSQCRRTSGHFVAATRAPTARLRLIAAGTLDPPTHLRITQHLFIADKSDYYQVAADGEPCARPGGIDA